MNMSSPFGRALPEAALQWLRQAIDVLSVMPRRHARSASETFGQRLARLRQARGLTQRDLARVAGITQRAIAYYEGQTDRPPVPWLPHVASALGVTLEELLGVRRLAHAPPPVSNARLWKRLQRIEQLPEHARKAVLNVLDGYLARYSVEGER